MLHQKGEKLRGKRNRKEIKLDSQKHYSGLAKDRPPGYAARQFIHKAYAPFVQGKEPEHKTVLQYMNEKCDLSEVIGNETPY